MLTLEQILKVHQLSAVSDFCRRYEALGLKHYLESIRDDLEKQDITPEVLYGALVGAINRSDIRAGGRGWKATWPLNDREQLKLIRFWQWPTSTRRGHRKP